MELVDLGDQEPERVAARAGAFDRAAAANHVYPSIQRNATRAPAPGDRSDPVARTFFPGTQTIPRQVIGPLIDDRDFTVSARFHQRRGDEGVIYAVGDRHSGFVLLVEDGELAFTYNAYGRRLRLPRVPLAPGSHEVTFAYDASGDRRGSARLLLDGEEVAARRKMEPSLDPAPFEGLDVGLDRRGPMDPRAMRRRGAFPYGGEIEVVTIVPGQPANGERDATVSDLDE